MENMNTNVNANVETGTETGTETTKTYTQEEVNQMLQAEADKRVTEALKKAEQKKIKAVEEAKKLGQMNEQQKYEYQLQQKEKELNDRLTQISLMENKNEASKILSEKGLSLSLVDFVVAEDAETMMANITLLDNEFKKCVKAEVEKRLSSSTPKKNLPLDGALTKESFNKMSLAQQTELFKNNPDLYKSLTK